MLPYTSFAVVESFERRTPQGIEKNTRMPQSEKHPNISVCLLWKDTFGFLDWKRQAFLVGL